jgi:hypothetical protein
MSMATAEIESSCRPRHLIQEDLRCKENARKLLAKRYANAQCSSEDILNAIYSFSDNNTYLLFNRDPVDRMITYLKEFFSSRNNGEYSLAISSGATPVTTLLTAPSR